MPSPFNFNAAFSGFLGANSARWSTSTVPFDYLPTALPCFVFALAVDAIAPAPIPGNENACARLLASICQGYSQGRTLQSQSVNPADYADEAAAIAAEYTLALGGLSPEGGGGGAAAPFSIVKIQDDGTAVPVPSQDGSVGSPYGSVQQVITASPFSAAVQCMGSSTGPIVIPPGGALSLLGSPAAIPIPTLDIGAGATAILENVAIASQVTGSGTMVVDNPTEQLGGPWKVPGAILPGGAISIANANSSGPLTASVIALNNCQVSDNDAPPNISATGGTFTARSCTFSSGSPHTITLSGAGAVFLDCEFPTGANLTLDVTAGVAAFDQYSIARFLAAGCLFVGPISNVATIGAPVKQVTPFAVPPILPGGKVVVSSAFPGTVGLEYVVFNGFDPGLAVDVFPSYCKATPGAVSITFQSILGYVGGIVTLELYRGIPANL